MRKVYDCFTFFNELDLLEVRLNELYNSVDYFVIAEANMSHSGRPKEYILEQVKEPPYELNVETFLKFYHKDGLGNVLKNVDYWIRENWNVIDRYNKAKNK